MRSLAADESIISGFKWIYRQDVGEKVVQLGLKYNSAPHLPYVAVITSFADLTS